MTKIFAAMMILALKTWALDVKMLEIRTEDFPEELTTVALTVDDANVFQSFIYTPPKDPQKIYTITQLNEGKQSLKKKSGVEIIEVSGESLSTNNININIHFLHRYKLIGKSERKVKPLRMFFESPTNLYLTEDLETRKIITKAFVYINYVDGKEKGIDRIETF